MARKTKRLERQRIRQQEYRDELRQKRRPTRDDFARFAFHWLIVKSHEKHVPADFWKFADLIAKGVVEMGFDPTETVDALNKIIERYVDEAWDFRRKVHLGSGNPPVF